MPASTDTEAEALAWVNLLGTIAASCDLYAAHAELQVNWTAVREGDRSRAREVDELDRRQRGIEICNWRHCAIYP